MRRSLTVFAAIAAGAALLLLGSTVPAAAAPTTEVIQGEHLRIVSTADWHAAANLDQVAAPVPWDLTISAAAPEPGTVTIALSAFGGTVLVVEALTCAQPWTDAGCASGARVLRPAWAIPRDGSQTVLTVVPDTEVTHLRLTVALSADGAPTDARPTELRVHAIGVGESVVAGGGGLATTGSDAGPRLMAIAGGLLLAGGLLVAFRRRRPRPSAVAS